MIYHRDVQLKKQGEVLKVKLTYSQDCERLKFKTESPSRIKSVFIFYTLENRINLN